MTLADDANELLVVPAPRRGRPPSTTAIPAADRDREFLMPLYGAYQGRKLDPLVAEPFVRRGWLTVGGRRDWLTEAGRAALRSRGFEL